MPVLTVASLAALCGGEVSGDADRPISSAAALEDAHENDLSFVANERAAAAASSSRAGCLIVPAAFHQAGSWSLIRVADPRAAFARVVAALYPPTRPAPGIHPTAVIAAGAHIAPDCSIGAHVSIGDRTTIAPGCTIAAGCVLGDDVTLGPGTTLHPNVTIYDAVRIGARAIIHSGCVLGADGFGFALVDGRYQKFPQIGTVELGDDVEIGANCCIDRAALGVTRIGSGTKLDNLVHVAHNCTLGEHVVVAAQTGFSGSVTVGDYAVIGGQTGIGEKARIDSRAIVGGKSGVLTGQRIEAGEPVWGIPARPLRQHLKGLANVSRLASLRDEVRALKQQLAALAPSTDRNES